MFSARFCGGEGYGFFSVVGSDLVCEMAEDSESREEEEWLQLSIGRQDLGKNNGPGSGLVELDLMPSSSSSSHSQMRPKFRPPRPVVNFGPRPDFVVVAPPRRPHSGVWFMLQASQNQESEPFLPQISKSYLRIKDGRMTIRVVIKYLVKKLSLDNESEIEIRCKGQRLLPMLTLEHVRDNIWSRPRDFITLIPNSSTIHHIMVLHYARSDPSN
ncbi:protein LAX PANICLE 2-like isoform X2 [Salvia hispanica]|uniref:protein LAX PANICLE 2-like isoform X2 n=1 Tax=Salvia hispanica TaxID=49212 RepID=UPI0020096E77|nr:protein LAX PANICLE 2-like isoform X2 [Salvia hispanica]